MSESNKDDLKHPPINLVICWHMHQPYYRDGLNGEYVLPWVYLHGIKDYDDMAAHFERYPSMRAVVNFAPVLLEQLHDYSEQINEFLTHDTAMTDPILNLLAGVTPIPDDIELRKKIISDCSRAHAPKMIEPYPKFKALFDIYNCTHEEQECGCDTVVKYLGKKFFIDLLTWYHLAWLSHSLKQRSDVQKLIAKGGGFTKHDRCDLIQIIGSAIQGIIPRYKALADRGQIEISMTPYGHPIIPLLNSFDNMIPAQPESPMPIHPNYPHGRKRSLWHLQHGLAVFEKFFKRQPKGVWLSEGGVSEDAIELLNEMGIAWTATGEAVWHNSRRAALLSDTFQQSSEVASAEASDVDGRKKLFMPYRLKEYQTQLFFRDDGLSDLIGFEYSDWHSDDAVANFVHNLNNIRKSLGEQADEHVVSVILDGENAWEYYPENGHYFLDNLYKTLTESDAVSVKTFTDITQQVGHHVGPLNSIVPGSWVYGSFSTWIGDEEKNYAWDLLVQAKQHWDEVIASGKLSEDEEAEAIQQLAICEGSDWFWWFGDYNPSDSVSDFDKLYRRQLTRLYQLLGEEPPEMLQYPISEGGGNSENSGTMRRNG